MRLMNLIDQVMKKLIYKKHNSNHNIINNSNNNFHLNQIDLVK